MWFVTCLSITFIYHVECWLSCCLLLFSHASNGLASFRTQGKKRATCGFIYIYQIRTNCPPSWRPPGLSALGAQAGFSSPLLHFPVFTLPFSCLCWEGHNSLLLPSTVWLLTVCQTAVSPAVEQEASMRKAAHKEKFLLLFYLNGILLPQEGKGRPNQTILMHREDVI